MNGTFEAEKIDFNVLKSMVLFCYSTKSLSKKDKVRFFYALNGRNKKPGILKKFSSVHLGVTSILVPFQFKFYFIDFLKEWNISFVMREMLVE